MIAHRVLEPMLVQLMPSPQTSIVSLLLNVGGDAFASIDSGFLVSYVRELVEFASTSCLDAGTPTQVAKLQNICTTSWQPIIVLTGQGDMGGVQAGAFSMLASAKLADLQSEIKSRIHK